MKDVTLYDAYNRPIKKADLVREFAAPTLTGIRTLWTNTVASGLTPQRLASILQNAADGDASEYLTLAEEMEEKEPHYSSVLGTRKRAVKRLPAVVESYSDSAQDKKLADAVRDMVRKPGFKGMLEDALDALGKGYSCTEIMWDRSGSQWFPKEYIWRDPRFFTFDRIARREIRLLDEADMMNGVPLAPYKFIVHVPKLKTGIPIRGGLARLVAWSYLGKNYTFKDWLAFIEVFGMPLRVGRYGPSATEGDINILKTAVANLGSDAAAVLPESMKIEFVEAIKSAGGDKLFQGMAEWVDKQTSKAVLGQTMTADDGSSQSQATVHNEVREDIRDSDAEQLEETVNRDLVRAYIDLNFGPQKNYPSIKLHIAKAEDIQLLITGLEKLVPLGLKVEQSVVRDKLGWPDPAEGAELLGNPPQSNLNAPQPPLNLRGGVNRALNQESPQIKDTVDHFTDRLMTEVNLDPMISPIEKLLNESASLEEFRNKLLNDYSGMDPVNLGNLIQRALGAAELAGRFEVLIPPSPQPSP
ncbi:hypothetical protein A2V82_16490 [candidate division KSB1 bacterium RBG_16_48_16]|nr:MAG: hypothetical protein A2V82_16490 [candidate division KSB1 bacterium RBG_16_48_16]